MVLQDRNSIKMVNALAITPDERLWRKWHGAWNRLKASGQGLAMTKKASTCCHFNFRFLFKISTQWSWYQWSKSVLIKSSLLPIDKTTSPMMMILTLKPGCFPSLMQFSNCPRVGFLSIFSTFSITFQYADVTQCFRIYATIQEQVVFRNTNIAMQIIALLSHRGVNWLHLTEQIIGCRTRIPTRNTTSGSTTETFQFDESLYGDTTTLYYHCPRVCASLSRHYQMTPLSNIRHTRKIIFRNSHVINNTVSAVICIIFDITLDAIYAIMYNFYLYVSNVCVI